MKSVPLLSIVIITKDTKDLLKDLLKSVEKDTSLTPFLKEIVVVDNGSTDGTESMMGEEFPSAILVRNEKNLGFAASANLGFRNTTGNLVFFLNSDTLLIEGEMLKILRYMQDNEDVGICGPQLVYPDMRLQRSSAEIPSLASEIFPKGLRRLFSSGGTDAKQETEGTSLSIQDGPHAGKGRDVESLIGAAIVVRRAAFEQVGGFDEMYFFFLEETDLCVRIRNAGFRLTMLPEAKVVHLQGKTVRKNWVRGRIEYNISMHKFIRAHYSRLSYWAFQTVRLTKTIGFLIILTCIPILLLSKRSRRTYHYYSALVMWHLRGCQDGEGLRMES